MLAPHEDPREENLHVKGSRNGGVRREHPTFRVERMDSFSIDSVDIGYSDRGAGEPVFLVHAGVFSDWFLPVSRDAVV